MYYHLSSKMYSPAEDSYLLQEVLKKVLLKENKNLKILDMGTGSGIQALTCKQLGFKNLLAADIDKEAVKETRKLKIKAVQSNLFSNIKSKFDLIIFNPPYLPEDKFDKARDTTAGKQGYELILRFLKQAKKHLAKQGKILLLISSLSNPRIIKQFTKKYYNIKLLKKEKLFFETLEVWLLTRLSS